MPKVLFAMRDDGYMTEPMAIMLLSAILKQRDSEWTTDLTVLERDDLRDVLRTKKPDVVAFSAITGAHQTFLAANALIKQEAPSVKTVIGGPYATFRPQLVNEHPFDAVGVGECDDAWPELMAAWKVGGSIDNIPNIVTRENASRVLRRSVIGDQGWTIRPEHLRSRKSDLDVLPFMDRNLVYANTAFRDRPKRTMMAGRGCPYRCTYCFEHAWNAMYREKGKRVMFRMSVDRLCAELVALKRNWDTRYIKMYDDVFPVTDGEWLKEFAEKYPRLVGLPFHCLVRAEMVTEKRLRLLKQAGISSLSMSIEAGNPFVRDYVLARDMRHEHLRDAFALCRKLRIHTMTNSILAIPAPLLPNVKAPREEYERQLRKVLTVSDEVDPQHRKARRLSDQVKTAQDSAGSEHDARMAVDRILREAGVRATAIEYDKDSVVYSAKRATSFGEFPVFFPYQGTQLGEYAVRHGYFNGNYDELAESYQTESPLGCFTPKEKLQQQNLALLGTIVLFFAGSFNPALNVLARPVAWLSTEVLADLPLTKVYIQAYSVVKNQMQAKRIYTIPRSWRERLRDLRENFRLDRVKQRSGWRTDKPGGLTLGGSPAP